MGYVFISYSSKEKHVAVTINNILKNNGIPTWMAPDNIPAGSKYASIINQAIRNCSCLTVLLTKGVETSAWVPKEIEKAISYGKKIMPIGIDKIILNDELDMYLSSEHCTQLSKIDENSIEMQSVIKTLKSYLDISETNTPTTTVTAQKHITELNNLSKAVTNKTPAGVFKKVNYDNGDYYEGYVVDGKRAGKGKYVWVSGNVYDGDWKDNKRTGKGKYVWVSGAIYEGDWLDNKKTGKGKYVWANGDVYVGDWLNDNRVGKGKFTWANGNIYEGDYVDDKRTGKGKFTWVSGDVYQGDFIDGKKTGKGKYVWASGSIYEGDWLNDKRSGKGKYVWASGSIYVGEWKDNKRTGKGKYTFASGVVQEGYFEDDVYIGKI